MDDRFNFGNEVRELKLGASFKNLNSREAVKFHTLKYDFKPASVDVNKAAKLDVSTNNQVTVTVPHLDGSGVPNTVFKGNQRDYTKKECVLIINRDTGEIVLERLHNNIQVKKTRHESGAKASTAPIVPLQKNHLENHTARFSSKTKVSTGNRNNRNTINFVSKNSPSQNSPSYPHKSPQGPTAPAWNANNTQQTLPSIPIIGLDDMHESFDEGAVGTVGAVASLPAMTNVLTSNKLSHNQDLSSSSSSSDTASSESGSDSDSDDNQTNHVSASKHHAGLPNQTDNQQTNFLSEDLRLSESNSDSDD